MIVSFNIEWIFCHDLEHCAHYHGCSMLAKHAPFAKDRGFLVILSLFGTFGTASLGQIWNLGLQNLCAVQ